MRYQRLGTIIVGLIALFLCGLASATTHVGLVPPPTLEGITASATARYDSIRKLYSYTYIVSNGAASTGKIGEINIDVAAPTFSFHRDVANLSLTLPVGGNHRKSVTFEKWKSISEPLLLPPGYSLVPYGLIVPDGWSGDLSRDGYASFGSNHNTDNVPPGQTQTGLVLLSPGVPVIREMIVVPWWVPVFSGEPTHPVAAQSGQVERDIQVHLHTLAPAGTDVLDWSTYQQEVAQAIKLGWIPDAALAHEIQAQLESANAAILAEDGTRAKQILNDLLTTLADASASDIRTEARNLVVLNAKALIRFTPDTPIPVTPKYSVTPAESAHVVGEEATLVAHVVNSSNHDKPLPGFSVRFSIVDGPDRGQDTFGRTGADGTVTFSFTGHAVGTDTVWLAKRLPSIAQPPAKPHANLEHRPPWIVAAARVHWRAGPDMVVPLFIPPVIKAKGGTTIQLVDWTKNRGRLSSPPSVTRYYLSRDKPVDPSSAIMLAERHVGPLKPGEISRGDPVSATLPSDLPVGVYHLLACADATHKIPENHEDNNCSSSKLKNTISMVVPVVAPANSSPDCSDANPTQRLLWPPNHKLHSVAVTNISDPDGDKVTVTITGIEQDEPVDAWGDGHTAPDAFGVGSHVAQVRAEREGMGSGRLYFIHFQAKDDKGASCKSTVVIGVPHDRSQHGLPKDTGERYDSTKS